ncbi:MAG: iron-containing alcohol dehydrogenase [Promethearchaeota archaeon]
MIRKALNSRKIYNNIEVQHGKGAISCLKHVPADNPLLFLSRSVTNTKHYDKVKEFLENKDAMTINVHAPSKEFIEEIIDQVNEFSPDIVIAIGGGKVIDVAKIVRCFLANPGTSLQEMRKNRFLKRDPVPFVAAPTTPGTGSEANIIAVIRNIEHDKDLIPIINLAFMPDLAILDHGFLSSLTIKTLFLASADIFTHAFEGSISILSSPILSAIGWSALDLLKSGLEKLKNKPSNTKALAEILQSGHLGGIVQGNAHVGIIHALSHAMLMQKNISHDQSMVAIMEPVMSWMKEKKPDLKIEKYINRYHELGIEKYKNKNIFDTIDVEKWIHDALKDPSISTCPIRFNKQNLEELVKWILT